MIADPDVNNADVSKRYTHDTIRPISWYGGDKKVDLGFVGSCMVHKGDVKIVAQMLRNLEQAGQAVAFNAPLVVAAPTYNIIDELKAEGDWAILQKYSGFEFDDSAPKQTSRTDYENILYLERPGCNLCMGNQEKAAKGDTVLAPQLACSKAVWWKTRTIKKVNPCWPQLRLWCSLPSLAARQQWMNISKPWSALTSLNSPHRFRPRPPQIQCIFKLKR